MSPCNFRTRPATHQGSRSVTSALPCGNVRLACPSGRQAGVVSERVENKNGPLPRRADRKSRYKPRQEFWLSTSDVDGRRAKGSLGMDPNVSRVVTVGQWLPFGCQLPFGVCAKTMKNPANQRLDGAYFWLRGEDLNL